MKVVTILGTRPEIIRLSRVIKRLDERAREHVLVYTNQNYDPALSRVFFEELGVRQPNYIIPVGNHGFGAQVARMFETVENVLKQEKPDAVLVLGDTNSALSALVAARMGIPVYHMEAGNRCFDVRVPEEINRRVIDAVSMFNLPYTPGSRENLLREGMPAFRVWVSGNPILEVLEAYSSHIDASPILQTLGLNKREYLLVTAHRQENVDSKERLSNICEALSELAEKLKLKVIVSVHPRTRERIRETGIEPKHELVRLCEPFGFFDFVHLEKNACAVLTDSGTVQEESCLFHVPAVTIRYSTERPETVTCGSNLVSGVQRDRMVEAGLLAVNMKRTWPIPEGYGDKNVSDKVTNFILGGLGHV